MSAIGLVFFFDVACDLTRNRCSSSLNSSLENLASCRVRWTKWMLRLVETWTDSHLAPFDVREQAQFGIVHPRPASAAWGLNKGQIVKREDAPCNDQSSYRSMDGADEKEGVLNAAIGTAQQSEEEDAP